MKLILNHLPGDLTVNDNTEIFGSVAGTVTVTAGGILHLFGSVGGDLVVAGGSAFVYGTVDGDAINWGGALEISGNVAGSLIKENGETTVFSCAIIGRE